MSSGDVGGITAVPAFVFDVAGVGFGREWFNRDRNGEEDTVEVVLVVVGAEQVEGNVEVVDFCGA
jgi:hypothetical protein